MTAFRHQLVILAPERNDPGLRQQSSQSRDSIAVEARTIHKKSRLKIATRGFDSMCFIHLPDSFDRRPCHQNAALPANQVGVLGADLLVVRDTGRWDFDASQTMNMRLD